MIKHRLFIVLFIVSIVSCNLAFGQEPDLQKFLTEKHFATIKKIEHLNSVFEYKQTVPAEIVVAKSEFWKSGNTHKIVVEDPVRYISTMIATEDENRQVLQQRQAKGDVFTSCMRFPARKTKGTSDPWQHMLLSPITVDGLNYNVEQFLKLKKHKVDFQKIIRQDRDFILMAFITNASGNETKNTFEFDSKYGYLITKSTMQSKDGTLKLIAEIQDFHVGKNGEYMPIKCHIQNIENGRVTISSILTNRVVAINEPIEKNVFQFPIIPDSTICRDYITETKYPIDPQWKQNGPSVPNKPIKFKD